MHPVPPVVLDFINKVVLHPGSGPDDDQRYQQFLAQQRQQLAATRREKS